MYSNGYNIYKQNSVNYASKDKLLLMLVDGAVNFAKRAETALESSDVKNSHINLVKTQDIFVELMATLDTSAGEWAQKLYMVYEFIYKKLIEINLKKDLDGMKEIIPLIEDIRDTWYAAYEKAKQQA